MTCSLYQPTSQRRRDSLNKNFLDIRKRTKKKEGEKEEIRDGDDYAGVTREII